MRYIIGVDLGTTNCCVSYIDLETSYAIHPFKVPQVDRRGVWQKLSSMPSVCFIDSTLAEKSRVAWGELQDYVVGELALSLGAKEPSRAVMSAKSWLCHSGIDRRHRFLPLDGEDEKLKISPVEATARFLKHIRNAWDSEMARGKQDSFFHEQQIILTIPASFDETARLLTLESAQKAGLSNLTLLEEPQAAFYAWLSGFESGHQKLLPQGSLVLVCDVGGGTTDFSLIKVADGEEGSFQRMAVGDHLLLGGDNMDEALMHLLESESAFKEHSRSQWLQLRHEVKKGKEALLSKTSEDEYPIVLQGKGSSVVKGSFKYTLLKQKVQKFLLDGFFRTGPWEEFSKPIPKMGLKTFGLPFESEASIIRQLGAFLGASLENGAIPTHILFNGGTMTPEVFQNAVVESLKSWFPETDIQPLKPYHLDLAVARGAAYLGKAKKGHGVKIESGSARAFYVSLVDAEGEVKALTILPRGAKEGVLYESEQAFNLHVGKPVRFELFSSNVRLKDQFSDLVEINADEMRSLPPLSTVLRQKKMTGEALIRVKLIAELTELGTLSLKLKSVQDGHLWKLEFQLKNASLQEDALLEKNQNQASHSRFDESWLEEGKAFVTKYFEGKGEGPLFEGLEKQFLMPKNEFPLALLRSCAESALKITSHGKWGESLTARWWNFVGFTLRPGFGFALDDHKIKELWKIVLSFNPKNLGPEAFLQRLIALRRSAGGFNRGQQNQIASEVLGDVMNFELQKGKNLTYLYTEKLRLIASLERIDLATKLKLSKALVNRLKSKEPMSVDWWALSRLAARAPLYGSVADVMPAQECVKLVESLLEKKGAFSKGEISCFKSIAAKSDKKELNLPTAVIDKILQKALHHEEYPSLHRALTEHIERSAAETEEALGDQLPIGLSQW